MSKLAHSNQKTMDEIKKKYADASPDEIPTGTHVDPEEWAWMHGKRCEDCNHVESLSRKRDWYYWRCLKAPAPPRQQFVVHEQFLHESPHKKCCDVNPEGTCELYEPQPKENPDGHDTSIPK